MNKFFCIGNLTKNPEYLTSSTGTTITNFSIAVTRKFVKDEQPKADFFNVVTFGNRAENCATYLKKGSKVSVIGQIQVNNYTTRDGIPRTKVDIIAEDVEFISTKQSDSNSNEETTNKETIQKFTPIQGELPF